MVEKMSGYIVDNLLYKNEKPTSDEREIMMFGITRILEDIPKYVMIFLIAFFLDILKDVGIVLIVTILYKSFLGGAHANGNIKCFIYSLITFITPSFIARYIEIPNLVMFELAIIINIFSLYTIIKYAPSDTNEVPILNEKKRFIMRLLSFISLLLINISLFFIKDIVIQKIVFITIFYSSLMSTNLAYKLLKCTRAKDSDEFKEYFTK